MASQASSRISALAVRFGLPLGPALWFPVILGIAMVGVAAQAMAADEAAPRRIAGAPMNILVPGMDTSPRDVIGWPVYGPALERIGLVESVHADTDGKIAGAIIALKVGKGEAARSVAVARREFVVHIGKFVMGQSGDSLRDLPPYEYASAKERGTIIPAGSMMLAVAKPVSPAVPEPAAPVKKATPVTVAAVAPEFSGSALIGAPVRNLADESIGSVTDLVVDSKGQMQAVLVTLDDGGRAVRLDGTEVRVVREEGGPAVVTSLARRMVSARLQQASVQ